MNFNLYTICKKYNSMITAISKYLRSLSVDRHLIKQIVNPCMPIFFENVLMHEKCSNIIYKTLNVKEVIPVSLNKWKTELSPYGMGDFSMQDVFKICFKTFNDFSVQWLQYRIIHRILPVSYYLKKICVKTNDLCRFCTSNIETIMHIFTPCTKTQTLWSELSLHIYRKLSERFGFNVSNIMFGEISLSFNNKAINFIILYTKQYTFICLMQNKEPSLIGLVCHLKFKYHAEK